MSKATNALVNGLAAVLVVAVATLMGCALAQPFQPNANAANTATNTASASPVVTIAPAASQPGR